MFIRERENVVEEGLPRQGHQLHDHFNEGRNDNICDEFDKVNNIHDMWLRQFVMECIPKPPHITIKPYNL